MISRMVHTRAAGAPARNGASACPSSPRRAACSTVLVAPFRDLSPTMSPYVLPILMLVASNVFMTFAWYGHLRFATAPLWAAVLVSWGIAFFEYWLAVPANRIGHHVYSAAQLKTMQEVITLAVFAVFSVLWLKEPLGWNHAAGFFLIACGAALIFKW